MITSCNLLARVARTGQVAKGGWAVAVRANPDSGQANPDSVRSKLDSTPFAERSVAQARQRVCSRLVWDIVPA